MDDSIHGKRDKRGNWTPFKTIEYAPVFVWPAQPKAFVKWLCGYPGFFLPWNLLYAGVGVVLWFYLTPSMETMRTFSVGWIAFIFARNVVIVAIFYGWFHSRLYTQKKQQTAFKFNGQWPSTNNDAFLFRNQNIDNLIWTFASGVPIWTAYEVLTLYMFANGYIPFAGWLDNSWYFVALMLAIPVFREVHFYLVHRLIHWPPLYRTVHKLHHNNVNPGPWSGLAMHPVEHLLYFSGVLIHWIIPSHPIHALFHLTHAALAPAPSHVGFDQVVVGDKLVEMPCYDHYLHHKYFECNYSEGIIPLDKWFGSFHDGSRESEDRMNERFLAQARKRAKRQEEREIRSKPRQG